MGGYGKNGYHFNIDHIDLKKMEVRVVNICSKIMLLPAVNNTSL